MKRLWDEDTRARRPLKVVVLGSAPLSKEPERWPRYVADSLIETTISRDVLLLTRVDKPALLRRLFDLGCRYSGQILSYTEMLGHLQDAGNATTLAHYLDLLAGAGMLAGLQARGNREGRECRGIRLRAILKALSRNANA